MNIYSRRSRIKLLLLLFAIAIGLASLLYTNRLVKLLMVEERKKVELWAEATQEIIAEDLNEQSISFLLNIIQGNETVPVIVTDSSSQILNTRNLDSLKISRENYAARRLEKMKNTFEPLVITFPDGDKQYIYYDKSFLLEGLIVYPYVQLSVILIFIIIAYLAFSSSRKAEQNQVWVGLSKETAHQLGTPVSSLMALSEIIRPRLNDHEVQNELDKDILRLQKIVQRFSKIGSKPKLTIQNLIISLTESLEYLKVRTSNKVKYEFNYNGNDILMPLNIPLFEWVIESLCKNAVDAMNGQGIISIVIKDETRWIYIDLHDTGKGIPKSKFKTIFKPGYTTKERGWGLGLSLTKRIIEDYHDGKIFVLDSIPGMGTTFRIALKK